MRRPTSGYGMATRGDVQGRDCSHNPSAFPPSMEVRCTNAAGAWQRIVPTILLHFRRPWRSDAHDSMARIVPNNPFAFPPSMAVRWRTTAGQGLFPTILLHFHRPWRSDAGRYDSGEGGGRVAPGAATESNAGDRQGRWKLEQRRSSCRSGCRGRTASGTAVEERPARVSSAVSCPK